MPREMFGDVSDPSVRVATRSRFTVPLSLAAHVVVVAAVLAVPLLAPATLPALQGASMIYVTPVLPPAPPPPAPRSTEPPRAVANPDAAPLEPPDSIRQETGLELAYDRPVTSDVGTLGIIGDLDTAIVAPPPPAPPKPPSPVRVGAGVRPPTKIRDVAPLYPSIAQITRTEGTVIIEAIIDTDGRVQSTRLLRSKPLLDEAALTAVRQWLYTPTLLNGTPVPVIMTVTVTFTLNR